MKKYTHSKVEKKWQKQWLKERVYEPHLDKPKKPFYNLMMFPYPSAEGLHIGGVRTFTGVDIYGRLKRMQGYDVFEPMGLDGFGIHSENYAIKVNKHPKDHAKESEKNFYRQLGSMGNSFAWEEKIETYDPEYYKWTQWIFIQMFKQGLAYRKKAVVNWCPQCGTVLADEQVIGGECERCGAQAIKKDLEQWFFKITEYADQLLSGLDTIDWSDVVKNAQRNWIGKSEGATITFSLIDIQGQDDKKHTLDIFTTRPDTLFGVTFMVVSPELAKRWVEVGWQASIEVKKYIDDALKRRTLPYEERSNKKTGIFSGISAINPVNNEKIPVWISDYVLADYGTGAIMAVPGHDERDFEFAKKYNLNVKNVISPWDKKTNSHFVFRESTKQDDQEVLKAIHLGEKSYEGPGKLVNSGEYSGLWYEDARWKIVKKIKGKRETQFRLRDWLISRQRYWGPPIPMIWCDACNKWLPEKEENLPVKLPDVKDFRPTGTNESPLANFPEFYETVCPDCGGKARRETDVSDTFLDSAWYYLRYLDPQNKKEFASQKRLNVWLPVHMYIGGAEHSVLHLLYVRFLSMALHDMKHLSFAHKEGGEPIRRFRAHGLITKDGAKMSKSRGNVVDPDKYIEVYGTDAVRMYLAFLAPLSQGGDFRDAGIRGMTRFLDRVWNYFQKELSAALSENLKTYLHRTIKKVSEDIEGLNHNTAISALMVLLTKMEKESSKIAGIEFLKLLAPFAPHITEEIWREILENSSSIHKERWPEYDEKYLIEDSFQLVVQVNGKTRDVVESDLNINEKDALKLALLRPKIETHLNGIKPKKVIFVPQKLINIVV